MPAVSVVERWQVTRCIDRYLLRVYPKVGAGFGGVVPPDERRPEHPDHEERKSERNLNYSYAPRLRRKLVTDLSDKTAQIMGSELLCGAQAPVHSAEERKSDPDLVM